MGFSDAEDEPSLSRRRTERVSHINIYEFRFLPPLCGKDNMPVSYNHSSVTGISVWSAHEQGYAVCLVLMLT